MFNRHILDVSASTRTILQDVFADSTLANSYYGVDIEKCFYNVAATLFEFEDVGHGDGIKEFAFNSGMNFLSELVENNQKAWRVEIDNTYGLAVSFYFIGASEEEILTDLAHFIASEMMQSATKKQLQEATHALLTHPYALLRKVGEHLNTKAA